jgi:hypothetical protein
MTDGFRGIDVEQLFLTIYLLLTGAREELGATDLSVLFYDWWVRIAFFSSIITPILLFGLAYVAIRYKQIRMEESEAFKAKAQMPHLVAQAHKNPQWQRVLDHISSESPNDWRIAILEADTILDELVRGLGYHGDNLGERLKSIDPSDMRTLEMAWEAHKVRNEVAHGTGDFILTQREAKRVVELFRQVFEEFDYI